MKINGERSLKIMYEFQGFMEKYGKYYKEFPELYKYVIQEFFVELAWGSPKDINRAIIEELGLNDTLNDDYYKNFIDYMKAETGIDRNLLEVGCGILPSLANRISKEQKSGSVTVMDPKVIESYEGNIGIVKKSITEETDVSKYDLIYGFYPCEATPTMIKSSFKNDKDLFIELCSCTHPVPPKFMKGKTRKKEREIYRSYLEYLLKHLSSSQRTYEIMSCSDLSGDVIRTYKPKNFH